MLDCTESKVIKGNPPPTRYLARVFTSGGECEDTPKVSYLRLFVLPRLSKVLVHFDLSFLTQYQFVIQTSHFDDGLDLNDDD